MDQQELFGSNGVLSGNIASNRSLQDDPKPQSKPIAIIRDYNSQSMPSQIRGQSDDDDDSSVDVERDARKLREKYGDKIHAAVSYHESGGSERRFLNAPYLGSMSKSENYLSLPPFTLSNLDSEPPSEIGQGYGSLRESHQRRQFLDGPASYRDTTGHVRRLETREIYSSSYNEPSISIGERMQRARKLQHIKKAKAKEDEPTSSLAAMMDQALKTSDRGTAIIATGQEALGEIGQSNLLRRAAIATDPDSKGITVDSKYLGQQEESIGMLSTSLTGLEVLMTASQLDQPTKTVPSSAPVQNSPFLLGPQGEIQDSQQNDHTFKHLSRSLSDPMPSQRRDTEQVTSGLHRPGPTGNLRPPPNLWNNHIHNSSVPITHPSNASIYPVEFSRTEASNKEELLSDHNPDMDAAFDMDME
jgi:hypothetical protein